MKPRIPKNHDVESPCARPWGVIGLAVALSVGLALATSVAEAQPARKVARVGVLVPSTPAATAAQIDALKLGLRQNGYVVGQNVLLEVRYAEARDDRLADLAAELVRADVDVIVALTDRAVQVVKHHARAIPVVMTVTSDPVGAKFVASLAKPGGNITGLTVLSPELIGKRLELLKEGVPSASRLVFLWNSDVLGASLEHAEIQAAARRLKLDVQSVDLRRQDELDDALAAATRGRFSAVVTAAVNPVVFANREKVARFAIQRRIPTIHGSPAHVTAGGLMSYGPDLSDHYQRAASYVDKILEGARPADLPVEQPTKFQLVINVKTAKALGLTIPASLLARADRVLE